MKYIDYLEDELFDYEFSKWLLKQCDRDDPVGDLANDFKRARTIYRLPYSSYRLSADHNSHSFATQITAWNYTEQVKDTIQEAIYEFSIHTMSSCRENCKCQKSKRKKYEILKEANRKDNLVDISEFKLHD